MREIKFREPVFTVEDGNDIFHKFHYWGCYGEWYHSPIDTESKHQQYTGLKDKNGVDIYEGDVIEVYRDVYAKDGSCKVVGQEYICNTKVVFYDGSFIVPNGHTDNLIGSKVIGNIHENPDLLNK